MPKQSFSFSHRQATDVERLRALEADVKSRTRGECWVWDGPTNQEGYGVLRVNGWPNLVHRLALRRDGVRTAGGWVTRTCNRQLCYNPDHLVLAARAQQKAKPGVATCWKDGCARPVLQGGTRCEFHQFRGQARMGSSRSGIVSP